MHLSSIIINALLIVAILTLNTSCGNSSGSNSDKEEKTTKSEEKNESQTLTCDECGTSFQKSNGVQLSGHSEVFCGQACATRWGFAHGISVK